MSPRRSSDTLDLDKVARVLLTDGWHLVRPVSFKLDIDAETGVIHPGLWFRFHDIDAGATVYGPMAAVQALEMSRT